MNVPDSVWGDLIALLKRAHDGFTNPTLNPDSDTNYQLAHDIATLLARIGYAVE